MSNLTDQIRKSLLKEEFKGDDGFSRVPDPAFDSKGSKTNNPKGVQDENAVGADNEKMTKGKGKASNPKALKSQNDIKVMKEDEEIDVDETLSEEELEEKKFRDAEEEYEDDYADKKAKMKNRAAAKKFKFSQKDIKENIAAALPVEEIDEDVSAIFGSEDLSEEFKANASELFKAAVLGVANKIVAEALSEMETEVEAYRVELEEEIEDYKSGLYDLHNEEINDYLTKVVTEWREENQVVLEQNAKSAIAESFMLGLKELFETHYFEIPEGKEDILETALEEVSELEERLEEEVANNLSLRKELTEIRKQIVINESTVELSNNQKNKIKMIAESIDFEDEETFSSTVENLKERFFPVDRKISSIEEDDDGIELNEEVKDFTAPEVKATVNFMNKYLKI